MTSSLDKMEYIERRWTQLLLQWINRCVATRKVTQLNPKSLAEVMAKYSKDICVNDFERAMLSTDDVEPFIKHKYPILRQRYPSEESDASKRLYIMSSLVLYHCCMSSKTGAVDEDIYKKLTPYEQELILKFCEVMCALEATVHNVERAIRDAIESVGITNDDERQSNLHRSSIWSESIPGSSCVSTVKDSNTTLPSDDTRSLNAPILNFNSSITVMPSIIADTSSYSELMTKSDTTHNMLPENYMYLDTGNLGAHSLGNTDTTNSQVLDDVLQGELYVTKKHADPKHRTTAQKGDMSPDKENNVLRNYSEKDQNRWSSYDSSTGKSSDYTDPTCSKDKAYVEKNTIRRIQESFSVLKSSQNFKKYAVAVGIVLLVIGIVVCTIPFMGSDKNMKLHSLKQKAQKLIEFSLKHWRRT